MANDEDAVTIDALEALTGQTVDVKVKEAEVSQRTETSEDDDLGDGGKKALDAERTSRREAEKQLKAMRRELDQIKNANLSEQERAVTEAKAAGFAEASLEAGKRLARAEIRAQASEKGLDVTALLEDLDLSRFVSDDGEPDDSVITAAIKRWAAIAPQSNRPRGDIGQGARSKPLTDPKEEFARLLQGG